MAEELHEGSVPRSGVIDSASPLRRSRGGKRTSGDWLRLALQGVGDPGWAGPFPWFENRLN
jgi:hypothetical protein